MCGVVAATAGINIVPALIKGLKKLEYRGYDSAGLAVIAGNTIQRTRSVSRVAELEAAAESMQATTGIAHPHVSGTIAVVRNGIIENYEVLRAELSPQGYPAGELKQGPLALVDAEMSVMSVAPNDNLLDKLKSNLKEVQARGGFTSLPTRIVIFWNRRGGYPSSAGALR